MRPSLEQIEAVFHQAVATPATARDAFLESACGDNAELRQEVESLLRYITQETTEIAAGVSPVAASLLNGAGADLHLPPSLGPYRLERKLGQGGMGVVYLATDSRLGRSVAVKVINAANIQADDSRARFLREARAAAALCHTNIATIYDVGEENGILWIVLEYVSGPSLRTRLAGVVGESEWLGYARQIAAALEHAHSRHIIHRDIKPENILLTNDGVLKMIDFGLARALHKGASAAITGPRTFIGTLAYAAPEILTGGSASARSDIYSAGIVLYELAYGEHPFGRDTGQALVARILAGDHARRTHPHFAMAVIEQCLARDPAARFRNGEQLASALRNTNFVSGLHVSRAPAPPELAIMDFHNIGGGADADWLSTGIAETLSADLAKLKSVRVASRSRVMAAVRRLAGSQDDPATAIELGRALGARWIVNGGYQRFGGRIRVTTALVDCVTGDSVATEKVDGTWDEIFEVQDRVVAGVLNALAISFGTTDAQKILPAETRNLVAYEHYVRGRQAMYAMDAESLDAAIRYFEQAVALDPDYAFAYSGLGTAYALLFISTSNPEDIARASRYLERAIELDPELGEPYPWLNNIRLRKNDLDGALAAGRKAVELQPDLPEAHYFFGASRYMVPELERNGIWSGAAHVARSIHLQRNFHAAWLVLGAMAIFAGRYSDAIRILTEAVRMESEPDLVYRFTGARTLLGIALAREGSWDEARVRYVDALESLRGANHVYTTCFQALSWCALGELELRCGDLPASLARFRRARRVITESRRIVGSPRLMIRVIAGLAAAYAASGDTERATEIAMQAAEEMQGPAALAQNITFECSLAQLWLTLAVAEVRLNRMDRAVDHLRRCCNAGWVDVQWLRTDPELRPLANQATFMALLENLASTPEQKFPTPL